MEYFHVYTKGLNKNLLFSCDEDFIYGMNLIPKCLRGTDIRLLAFCLMDNHLHFILGAPRDACNRFIVNYKRNLGAFLAGSGRKIGEAVEASVSRVGSSAYLMTSIAYVLRNPVVAGAGYIPQDYRWSSASLYYRRRERDGDAGHRTIGRLSYRERRALLKGRCGFPDEWAIDEDGMILPEFYTAVSEVESLFASVRRYLYYLSSNHEAEVNGAMNDKVRLRDADLRKEAVKICLDKFGTASVTMLDHGQRLLVCKCLRKEFGATFKQIGRIMHMDSEYVRMMI